MEDNGVCQAQVSLHEALFGLPLYLWEMVYMSKGNGGDEALLVLLLSA
jgi:hypothetical protein